MIINDNEFICENCQHIPRRLGENTNFFPSQYLLCLHSSQVLIAPKLLFSHYISAVSLEYNLSFTDFILLLSEVEMLLNMSSPVCQNGKHRLNKNLSKKLQVELNERKCYNKKQLGKKL